MSDDNGVYVKLCTVILIAQAGDANLETMRACRTYDDNDNDDESYDKGEAQWQQHSPCPHMVGVGGHVTLGLGFLLCYRTVCAENEMALIGSSLRTAQY